MLYREFHMDERGDDFARLMWAQKAAVSFVSRLPEKHWALPHLRNLDEELLEIGGRVLAKDYFSGSWVSGDVKLVDKLSVSIAGITHQLTEAVALGSGTWGVSSVHSSILKP